MDERRLIARAKQGDAEAFDQLVRRYWERIYRLAVPLIGVTEADDVAVETFEIAWQKLPQFRGDASLGTWLFRIALRVAHRRQHSPFHRHEEVWSELVPADEGLLAWTDPEELIRQREEAWQVHWALQQLPLPLREAVVLRFFEELSYAEMAQVLGVSETAVRKRVTAALRQLAVLLQPSPSPKRGEQA